MKDTTDIIHNHTVEELAAMRIKPSVELVNYVFDQYSDVVNEWLHRRASLEQVKAAHRAAKSLMGKLAQLSKGG